jgi:hypothetical protein
MYQNLGVHWATSVPAFLSLACLPFPFIFYKYGARIRKSCKYAAEASRIMAALMMESSSSSVVPPPSSLPEEAELDDEEKQIPGKE